MKVLLINPAAPNTARISSSIDFSIEDIGLFPPIGLIALAAYIQAQTSHTCSIVDQIASKDTNEELMRHISKGKYDVIGICGYPLNSA